MACNRASRQAVADSRVGGNAAGRDSAYIGFVEYFICTVAATPYSQRQVEASITPGVTTGRTYENIDRLYRTNRRPREYSSGGAM